MILLLIFFLFRKDGQRQDADSRIKALDNIVAQKEAEIGSLSDDILRLENIKSKARIDTIYIQLPAKRQKAATLPPMQRDSMFNATTDTVGLDKSLEPLLMVEPYRIAASNVLFTDLGERMKIIELQKNVIDTLEQNVSKQEDRFNASEKRGDALEEIGEVLNEDRKKLKKENWVLKYVVTPIALVIGLLMG
jgi:uncharacterized coiled-coil protein SlyX